jgi:predicted Fe-Mo cluster-binding NifX family protein
MKIEIAIATDNGKNLTKEHFGSAKKYLIYDFNLETGDINFLKEKENLTPEEKIHGDPEKASAVSEILKNVTVLINLVFGPNILRMKKKFVIIVSRIKEIAIVLEKLKLKKEIIKQNLNNSEKEIIYLTK